MKGWNGARLRDGLRYFCLGIATMDNCGGWYHRMSGKHVMVLYR